MSVAYISKSGKGGIALPYFMSFDNMTQVISLNPSSMMNVGTYLLDVRVMEVEAPSYFTDYMVNVKITPPPGVNLTSQVS